jgi:hypothetical protein
MFKKLTLTIFIIFLLAVCSYGQARNFLKAKCPNSSVYQTFTLQSDGNQNAIPCAGKNFLINGVAVAGTVTGTGSANFIPYWTNASNISFTPFSWDTTQYVFNNTALNSEYKLDFTPSITAGGFNVGDYAITPTYYFQTTFAGNSALASKEITLGDIENTSLGLRFDISDIGNSFNFTNSAGTDNVSFDLNSHTANFTISNFQISNSFAVASGGSKCAGQGTLGAGGTVNITATNCLQDTEASILVSYDDTSAANVLPLSATRTGISNFDVRGDANKTFRYWIVDRY